MDASLSSGSNKIHKCEHVNSTSGVGRQHPTEWAALLPWFVACMITKVKSNHCPYYFSGNNISCSKVCEPDDPWFWSCRCSLLSWQSVFPFLFQEEKEEQF
jgi:hypothetical protein